LWNPDNEEQRFCWNCSKWYHTECLEEASSLLQAEWLDTVMDNQVHHNVPKSIVQVAYQPTARGGALHFIAGNIRFVNSARLLLDAEARKVVETDIWMVAKQLEGGEEQANWMDWMAESHGIKPSDSKYGPQREQLLVENQIVFNCPGCGTGYRL
jgi:hypothetical protein